MLAQNVRAASRAQQDATEYTTVESSPQERNWVIGDWSIRNQVTGNRTTGPPVRELEENNRTALRLPARATARVRPYNRAI